MDSNNSAYKSSTFGNLSNVDKQNLLRIIRNAAQCPHCLKKLREDEEQERNLLK